MPSGIDVSLVHGVRIAAFDASRLGVWSAPLDASSASPYGPADALTLSGADVVLDGPMFSICGGDSYADATCASVRFEQYDAGRGSSFAGSSGGQGLTIAVVDGQAVVSDGASIPQGASVAVQLYPPLVRAGSVVASNTGSNADAEQRAALCVLSDGRVAFAVGAMDMVSFAAILASAGATDAGYTDGGGSAALWLSDGTHYGASEQRRVATWLVAGPASGLSALVPSSIGAVALVGGSVVGIGTLLWLGYQHFRRRL